jgi:hypothetical protein
LDPVEPPFDDEEPVPEDVLNAAKAAFGRRSVEEVAALVYDSLVDGTEPAENHVLRFQHDRLRFDVRVSATSGEVILAGSVAPTAEGRFELVIDQNELSFPYHSTDGSFLLGPVGHGLVRLSFQPSNGTKVQTDWFRI